MKYRRDKGTVTVRREEGEARCPNESAFWYRLKKLLLAKGLDVVKKCPDKDGHMTSAPFYLRERSGRFAIHDGHYALRLVHLDFNSREPVYLEYHA